MQTFLPRPDYGESADQLDNTRLIKQAVEAKQILRTLTGESNGWAHHPAVRMWAGYEISLASYGLAMCNEAILRNFQLQELHGWFNEKLVEMLSEGYPQEMPWWLGHEPFHRSHRSNLIRKDSGFYGPRLGHESPDLPYLWPISDGIRYFRLGTKKSI